ncbi:hypothetical protein BaRGS_00037940 [Batillaria attramentaria]|uniref:Uncharacterized protein n=1 Tax=Batillaria attramentaria TaxID=370345 RepID=A0ABD0J7J0_9CAEN
MLRHAEVIFTENLSTHVLCIDHSAVAVTQLWRCQAEFTESPAVIIVQRPTYLQTTLTSVCIVTLTGSRVLTNITSHVYGNTYPFSCDSSNVADDSLCCRSTRRVLGGQSAQRVFQGSKIRFMPETC